MHVRCPHCQNSIAVAGEASLSDIYCETCGSTFSVLDDRTLDYEHETPPELDNFELGDKLGAGTFGTVWRARDRQLDRVVAVKIPRQDQLTDRAADRFIGEARMAAQLNHPNIVRIFEVGRENDQIYIVSDFIDGVNLSDWLTARRPGPRKAAVLCRRVALALEHAHTAGIIHRDLKPSNIMIDHDGQPHVMDFGLAKREAPEVTVSVDGRVLGTPSYMSPEQARGDSARTDRRSDVYSLGVILFELLTGELPFRGNARMMLHQVMHEDPPSPRKLNGQIPRDLETICLRCLEKDPSKRFETAKELADEMTRYLNGEPIRSRPVSRWERGWRWCRRNPGVSIATGAAALFLLVGIAVSTFFAFRSYQHAEDARREKLRAEANAADARDQAKRAHELAHDNQNLFEKAQREATEAKRLAEENLRLAAEAETERRRAERQLARADMAREALARLTAPVYLRELTNPAYKFLLEGPLARFGEVREGARSSLAANRLFEIGTALQEYHHEYGHFPPAIVYGPDGTPWHSWRVLLLPYLGEEGKALFEQYSFAEPWNGPHNSALMNQNPSVYEKLDATGAEAGIVLVTGPGTAFPLPSIRTSGAGGWDEVAEAIAEHADELGRDDERRLIAGLAGEDLTVAWSEPVDLNVERLPPLGAPNGWAMPFRTQEGVHGQFLYADGQVLPISDGMSRQGLLEVVRGSGAVSVEPRS